jgi:hypothetical protein
MILLQAAIGAGILLFNLFIVFVLIGVIFFTSILMKLYRKSCNNGNVAIKKTSYKDIVPFSVSILFALGISIFLFLFFILFLDCLFPLYGSSN